MRSDCSMACGVVVSRGSPAMASFSVGSVRSSRVTVSPRLRAKAVKPCGPPWRASSRLAAVLSLSVTVPSHSSPTVMPTSPTRFSVTGE